MNIEKFYPDLSDLTRHMIENTRKIVGFAPCEMREFYCEMCDIHDVPRGQELSIEILQKYLLKLEKSERKSQTTLSKEGLKEARVMFNLTMPMVALVLGLTPDGKGASAVAKMESGYRAIPRDKSRLMRFYLMGHRPLDWPDERSEPRGRKTCYEPQSFLYAN